MAISIKSSNIFRKGVFSIVLLTSLVTGINSVYAQSKPVEGNKKVHSQLGALVESLNQNLLRIKQADEAHKAKFVPLVTKLINESFDLIFSEVEIYASNGRFVEVRNSVGVLDKLAEELKNDSVVKGVDSLKLKLANSCLNYIESLIAMKVNPHLVSGYISNFKLNILPLVSGSAKDAFTKKLDSLVVAEKTVSESEKISVKIPDDLFFKVGKTGYVVLDVDGARKSAVVSSESSSDLQLGFDKARLNIKKWVDANGFSNYNKFIVKRDFKKVGNEYYCFVAFIFPDSSGTGSVF